MRIERVNKEYPSAYPVPGEPVTRKSAFGVFFEGGDCHHASRLFVSDVQNKPSFNLGFLSNLFLTLKLQSTCAISLFRMLVSFTQWAAGQVTYLCSHHLSSIKGCCFWVSCKNLFANWVLWQPSRVLRDWDQCICGSLICSPMTSSLVWLRILYFIPNGVLCEQCSLDTVQR